MIYKGVCDADFSLLQTKETKTPDISVYKEFFSFTLFRSDQFRSLINSAEAEGETDEGGDVGGVDVASEGLTLTLNSGVRSSSSSCSKAVCVTSRDSAEGTGVKSKTDES